MRKRDKMPRKKKSKWNDPDAAKRVIEYKQTISSHCRTKYFKDREHYGGGVITTTKIEEQ